jgi:hypothetical protein
MSVVWIAVMHVWFAGVPIAMDRRVENMPFASEDACMSIARMAARDILRDHPDVQRVTFSCEREYAA